MRRVIGIDPGSQVGVAVIEDGRLVFARTYHWRDQRLELEAAFEEWGGEGVRAVVEMPTGAIWSRPGLSRAAMLKLAKNVGQCKARADEIVRLLKLLGCDVRERAPIRGGTKLTLQTWRAMFPEWGKKRISGHARDSAVLAKFEGGAKR